jgi:hypothetical protein
MGALEALMALGVVVLFGALAFGALRGRRRRGDQAAADAATRRNFNSQN